MPFFVIVGLLKMIFEIIRFIRTTKRKVSPELLCTDCEYAHVQYAANAKRAISCAFGGSVRLVKVEVLYCTDYRRRGLPTSVRPIGFVHEIAQAD